ncbi:hypothetical protein [Bacillus alkalicellulosilyticus]|uniref:hypothetical protein n=1 Tax=Alkalihalobacterium alkalicellulosilyticum TaxID=1912214 RepID=UPI000998BDC5|nr:hypothetical protein [Bacillus alkalicellulosilyticus]
MRYVFKEAHSENELMTKFIELVRLNKHVKLNKSNPTLAYSVKEFITVNNVHPMKLIKLIESSMTSSSFKTEFPIEVIENANVTDFHWVDNESAEATIV